MRDPEGLYELSAEVDEVPHGLHLIAGLTGFTDAGSTITQLSDYLLENLESRRVALFDADALLDYRARRPIMFFDEDHLAEYKPATLALYLVEDELHQPFLLLTGYEPDFQWERFTAAVLGLIERYQVRDTTWIHAIPMPVPHTRPIGVTVSGNRKELVESMSVWRPTTQVPANALHLLEYRLQEKGHPTAALVLLVPHYLADTEFPLATVRALESISAATGLIFPTDPLRELGREFMTKVDEQVSGNAELQRLVETLEKRHDSYMEENPLPSPFASLDGEIPGADSIAAELERFLATRPEGDDQG
ncbi:MAG: PAC2 family protein [Actinomycetales bacterium]|nr:PAC2 family protein [Actinomycetales bacterium]